ncbi:MAG TPA: polyprenol monophosphomannose synthase [Egibacteraceae bacterium]|nr:polyprenol monophosphomannose synthase [Egibacteraceae bacterium]
MRALVVVPTYNEVASVEQVVGQSLASDPGLHVLVVDDASPDGTGALADALAGGNGRLHVLHRSRKQGLGSAYRAGFAWGLAHGYEALAEMDADASHDPADLPRLLQALAGADVVVGSRYVPGGAVEDWSRHRLLLSRGGNAYARAVTGLHLADATSGFRAFRPVVLRAIRLQDLRSDGYAFQLETALRAWRLGFRLVEIPIIFTERRQGASKLTKAVVVEAVARVAVWGLTGPRGPAAVHPASVAAPSASS